MEDGKGDSAASLDAAAALPVHSQLTERNQEASRKATDLMLQHPVSGSLRLLIMWLQNQHLLRQIDECMERHVAHLQLTRTRDDITGPAWVPPISAQHEVPFIGHLYYFLEGPLGGLACPTLYLLDSQCRC